jgi:hypothetical protein
MQNTCRQCAVNFEITNDDLAFYDKISPVIKGKKYLMPPPALCPGCRERRRWTFRNQRFLYKRKCDFSGDEIISLYSPDKPYKVYKEEYIWSDEFDPLKYGRDYDLKKDFFEQFHRLRMDVPRGAMQHDGTDENCEYSTYGANNKNCYLACGCGYCMDVYYSTFCAMEKDSFDCFMCSEGELQYECLDTRKCYNCFFCMNCSECRDSIMLEDCRNCSNCICCKNLRNRSFHVFNKQVTEDEFRKLKQEFGSHKFLEEQKQKFGKWKLGLPCIYAHITNSENCDGDNIEHSKNCHNCFDIVITAENCKYCQFSGWQGLDMMDTTMCGLKSELVYEMDATVESYNCAFMNFCRNARDSYYCDNVNHCDNCFGCVNLPKHKSYCILNKQYTKDEYEDLVPKIIERMQKNGEWGEFFPSSISPFGYNETVAPEFFPLTKKEAIAKGFNWSDYESPIPEMGRVIAAKDLPDNINDVTDDILKRAVECEITKKPFRIIKQELEFYRKQNLPVPRRHHDRRHKDRMALRNPLKLWSRKCAKCGADIRTSYSPGRPEIVYCENCYLKEVY